jgi:HD-like signal output (HDOD) protein/prolyl-tRNA editing enzyme YbaK/EbsC (Cys-tRNA(Pro) deacylase)
MNIPTTVRTYLATKNGQYKVRVVQPADSFESTLAAARLSPAQVARTVLMKSGSAYLMAIVPADREVDPEALKRLFKRDFTPCSDAEVQELMPNCAADYLPPLAEPYGLKAIQDKRLRALENVYFTAGVPELFVRASRDDFAKLQVDAWRGYDISRESVKAPPADAGVAAIRDAIKRKVQSVNTLPTMPGIAAEIIRLRNNPYSHASELAAVIEQDPSLSAQLLRYATSPLYAYQGKVESVEQAIVRVLGMDFVYDIAFGLSLGKTFRNPKEGPLGLNAFWHHAVRCATLTQALCNAVEYSRRPPPGVGYLAGLLHNFGFLLLGHLFPEQFERLNRTLAEQPDCDLEALEREVVGVTHTELGLWLMDAWDMPKEIIEAVSEHHNPAHRSDYSIYANLVCVANALLKRQGIGDAATTEVPAALLTRIGLGEQELVRALGTLLKDEEGLDFIARKMAA